MAGDRASDGMSAEDDPMEDEQELKSTAQLHRSPSATSVQSVKTKRPPGMTRLQPTPL